MKYKTTGTKLGGKRLCAFIRALNKSIGRLVPYFHCETPPLRVITRQKHKFTRNIRNTYLQSHQPWQQGVRTDEVTWLLWREMNTIRSSPPPPQLSHQWFYISLLPSNFITIQHLNNYGLAGSAIPWVTDYQWEKSIRYVCYFLWHNPNPIILENI